MNPADPVTWKQPHRVIPRACAFLVPHCLGFLREIFLVLLVVFVFQHLFPEIAWWLFLGVISSVGMGFGVNTGITKLYPATCLLLLKNNGDIKAAYFQALWPAFWWGTGAALGELPPYLLARFGFAHFASSLEVTESSRSRCACCACFAKCAKHLRRYPWPVIFGMAAWPNMSFDACGIMAGTLKIPVLVFLSATWAGKALVKAPLIEVPAFLLVCSNPHLQWMTQSVTSVLPIEALVNVLIISLGVSALYLGLVEAAQFFEKKLIKT